MELERPAMKSKILPPLLVLILSTGLLASCDKQTKQKALNFFFTGVPPLAEEHSAEPTATVITGEQTEQKGSGTDIISAHSYYTQRKCAKCHGTSMSLSRENRPPQESKEVSSTDIPSEDQRVGAAGLCLRCHPDPFKPQPDSRTKLHAPVKCTVCHLPHHSPHVALLRKKHTEICAMCHPNHNYSGKGFHGLFLKNLSAE